MIKIFPMFVLFVITAFAVLTDGFDFTLYREQLKKSKKNKEVKNETDSSRVVGR